MTTINITQHAVGQGGMLSGFLESHKTSLHWVYDCGSLSHATRCREEILQIKNRGQVDVLFLSHLHNDHINETKKLIKECQVKEVVLPFLNQHLKKLKLVEAAANNELTEDYINYVLFPQDWFIEHGVNSISYIMPITQDVEIEPLTMGESPLVESPTWEGETEYEAENVKLFKSHSKLITPTANGILVLAPFAYSASDAFVLCFLDELKKKIAIDPHSTQFTQELLSLAKDKERIKKLKKLYDKYWKNHNSVSMTLFMGVCNEKSIWLKAPPNIYDSFILEYYLKKCIFDINWLDRCGWLATGDINLKDDACRNIFTKYYQCYINKVSVFSVPHHGSAYNWSTDLCTTFSGSHFIIEASNNNKYGHPSGHVIHDIVSNYLTYSWISEDPKSQFICEYKMQ